MRRLSAVLTAAAVAVPAAGLGLVPLGLRASPTWGYALVPLTLLTTPLWSLLHEAIHGGLLPGRRANDAWGRVLAIGYGAPFALLKAGHLVHHRYSRTPRERTEIYTAGSWASHAPGYYLRLFGGLYLAEVASVLLTVLPSRAWAALARRSDRPDTVAGLLLDRVRRRSLRQFRVDALAIVVVHAAAFVADGDTCHDGWFSAVGKQLRGPVSAGTLTVYSPGVRRH
ncbi:fatty acid desaturase [Cryptosporangium sp. NPDC051539]|uniref:fatty acid desaturase n=1 Tax=Cryptosporangium sp. NPDC051539 TaxID=3363962 RepID=UPI00378C53B0